MTPDRPTLVFIHGAGSNAGFWHEQQAAFPGARFPTLPGHFDPHSRRVTGEGMRSIDEYADWVEGYVSDSGLANVALNGRVSPQLLDLLSTDYPAAVDFILKHSFAYSRGPLSYAQKVRLNGTRRQLERTPQAVTLADYEACDRFDVTARLGEIQMPALCIVGALDEMAPPADSEYLGNGLPGARLVVVAEAGHMLPLEQPAAYNAALAEFVASL
jgi:pimeloyl-ACP methyl ester carboxylesterase